MNGYYSTRSIKYEQYCATVLGAEAALVTAFHQVSSGVGVAEHYEQHVSRKAVG
jgi:hypothetical protein